MIDRRWNLLRVNDGTGRLSQFLISPPRVDPSVDRIDLADALISPDGLRPFIANWEEVALHNLTTLGAPQDVALQETCIERFFPSDNETERFFRDRSKQGIDRC